MWPSITVLAMAVSPDLDLDLTLTNFGSAPQCSMQNTHRPVESFIGNTGISKCNLV